ncbi:glycosyltransferase [Caldilinea sp.]|jgi:D-inositol-3-phosphate glycosyltransferase|uniref:glycosyltransferase n=1 Tax=Caldilinea sp. TaxID=2293560 RepID=UPI0021DDCD3B|nr:glycosyltransferase [Caldilinea sp.]GIV68419.1 MAG: glycosyl transferase family 1 [Caldilinea sp.]
METTRLTNRTAPAEPLRVAMLSYHTCPLAMLGGKKTGGMNVYVRDLSRALAKKGITVDVFTRSQDDCAPRVVHDLGPGARVMHIPAGPERPIPVSETERYLDEFVANILDFAEREGLRYDVLHSHYWLSGVAAEALSRAWGGTPIVQMFHTLGHMKNQIARDPSERASQSRLDGETQVVRIADRIIAPTPAEVEQLVRLYGAAREKIVVAPPGVDLAHFHPIPQLQAKQMIGIPPQRKNILFAGRIEPLKGIDTLLEAIALLKERRIADLSETCVTIIGGNPWADTLDEEMERLQRMSLELGLDDLVAFAGARDQNILPYYYAAAEMVVMPSHYESFGMVALEAMAMGTPVIASEVGGLAYVVCDGYNGFLVPRRDAQALAHRIADLLNDRLLRERLSRNAVHYARDYDWAIIAERIAAVYEETLAHHPARA